MQRVVLAQQRVAQLFADITGLPVDKTLTNVEADVLGYSLTYLSDHGHITVRNTWKQINETNNHLRMKEAHHDS